MSPLIQVSSPGVNQNHSSSSFFLYSASSGILSALFVCPIAFPFQKQGSSLYCQLSRQCVASGVLEHDCPPPPLPSLPSLPSSPPLQSPSCQCENKAAAAQATTPASLKPAAHLQISPEAPPPSLSPSLPLASSASPLLCLSFFFLPFPCFFPLPAPFRFCTTGSHNSPRIHLLNASCMYVAFCFFCGSAAPWCSL